MKHYSVIGPPGTGKTTYLKGQVENAARAFGDGGVMVCSLTRAAAAEIRGRAESIPQRCVGTLHSFAYRALVDMPVAESKLAEWNEAHPQLSLSPSKGVKSAEEDDDDMHEGGGVAPGDVLYEKMEMNRHHRVPRDMWNDQVTGFSRKWSEWVNDSSYIDFTGMIERGFDQDHAPGDPLAMFVDEAQDMSQLEIDLVKHWAVECNTMVAVGDPAQAINTFRGANPEAFFDIGEPANQRVLAQSYRVPQSVHAAATRWAKPLLAGVEYRPADRPGSVREIDERLDDIAVRLAHDLTKHNGTVMFQAQAGYMVDKVVKRLKELGVPFGNPNRRKNGRWNPLARRKNTIRTADRLLAWLAEEQTPETVKFWLPLIKADRVLKKGAKSATIETDQDVFDLFVSDEAMAGAMSADPSWLRAHMLDTYAKKVTYPLAVWKRHGVSGIKDEPRLMVGTIHSFKGAEADRVFLCPDMSTAAFNEYEDEDRKPALRLFYVGMTRARDSLSILSPSGRNFACLT